MVTLIDEIAIADDGLGMSPEVLGKCLSFGWGTRLEGASGLGKFGFGLKGASISQAKRIEVYSWEENQPVYMTYLDYDEIVNNELEDLPEPEKADIPEKIKKFYTMPSSGTLIIWKDLERLNPKTSEALIRHFNKEMCRIFRHFLDDNDIYGTHRDVTVHVVNPSGNLVKEKSELLKANDPIYLHKPNNLPGYEGEATNLLDDEKYVSVIDPSGVERKVHVLSTIALPKIQSIGGKSDVGQHYANNNGISFVRAGRELELSIKGFFSNSEPRNRWHGIEVRFDPQLDEYFGVPNNKQAVRDFRNYDENELATLNQTVENSEGFEKHSAKMKLDLHSTITRMVRANQKEVTSRGGSKNNNAGPNGPSTSTKLSKAIVNSSPNTTTTSSIQAVQKTDEEKLEELAKLKMRTDTTLSEEEAYELAKEEINNVVQIEEDHWPGSTFLDVQFKGNSAIARINRDHAFFREFYDHLQNLDDQKGFEALRVVLMSYARCEDELETSNISRQDLDTIRENWGKHLKHLTEVL